MSPATATSPRTGSVPLTEAHQPARRRWLPMVWQRSSTPEAPAACVSSCKPTRSTSSVPLMSRALGRTHASWSSLSTPLSGCTCQCAPNGGIRPTPSQLAGGKKTESLLRAGGPPGEHRPVCVPRLSYRPPTREELREWIETQNIAALLERMNRVSVRPGDRPARARRHAPCLG